VCISVGEIKAPLRTRIPKRYVTIAMPKQRVQVRYLSEIAGARTVVPKGDP
jgi:hypothetical protein